MADDVPLPTDSERLLAEHVLQAASLTRTDFSAVLPIATSRDAYLLLLCATRMAVWAVRSNRPDLLRVGLIAMSLDEDVTDWRDLITEIAVLRACCRRLGVSVDSLAAECLHFAGPNRRRELLSFLERCDRLNDVELRATGSGSTFTIVSGRAYNRDE
jgi:hypothetical protein